MQETNGPFRAWLALALYVNLGELFVFTGSSSNLSERMG